MEIPITDIRSHSCWVSTVGKGSRIRDYYIPQSWPVVVSGMKLNFRENASELKEINSGMKLCPQSGVSNPQTGVQPFHDQIGIRKCPLLSDMVTDPSKE